MTRTPIGIDTSVLVRLLTGDPHDAFTYCVDRLSSMVEAGGQVFASNQVIGEAYVVLQHNYGVAKQDARSELRRALTSGLVAPLSGPAVLEALAESGGAGLMDRLIAIDYETGGFSGVTLDRRMSGLPGSRLL